ncbi:hypothetical protein Poly51_12610 [Rubripirellula tenax]|uniref:PEP-CTERM protein-sorting domain-containing protein n=1 Tax=Rubripirellula tenax TaxID=2528015 RepID=A0A5C6F9Q5_9BACT|nr:PEP-CTERM sorting domain-containing protein [Rubripirellula tenax]TWU58483.1 hypothetical protein Poly51_12610 [Rubripirellula tenax]
MRFFSASLVAVCVILPSVAQADLVLSFGSVEENVAVGQTFSVDIIATQTDNGNLIPGGDIRSGQDGLFFAGMRLVSSRPTVASSMLVTVGPSFSDSIITPSTETELFIESALVNNFIPAFALNTDPTSLILGTYSFTGLSSGSTMLTLVDPNPFDDWVFGNDAGENDAAVFAGAGSLTINVSAVPEPSSFVLVSCVAGLAIWRRRHRA